jgi:subtilase family serine protease
MFRCALTPRRPRAWAAPLVAGTLFVAAAATAGPLPDVAVSDLTLTPAAARVGDSVTASVTVRNRGGAAAAPSSVALLAVSGAVSPPATIALGSLAIGSLESGASQTVSRTFTVPAVPTGWLSIVTVADPAAALTESDEGNNRRTARLRVTVPDLAVSKPTLTPAYARVGDTVTATVIVRNAGQVPADQSRLRVGFDPGSGAPAIVVGSPLVAPLAAGESRTLSVTFVVPAVAIGHAYYTWAQIDADGALPETAEGNNRRGAWLTVTIPDLAITTLSLRPAPARAGDGVTASIVVRNVGRVRADASILRLSFDPGAGQSASAPTTLRTVAVEALQPGESHTLAVPFVVPAVSPGRAYRVSAQVDADDALAETAESNNRGGAWLTVTVPDLTVAALSVRPAPARPGDTLTVGVRFRNQGPVSTDATRAAFYVATAADARLDGVAPLTTIDVPRLERGKEASLAVTVDLPALSPGAYQLIAVADSIGAQAERVETNNRRGAGFRVAAPAVALDALDLTPATVEAGEPATATLQVTNRGPVPTYPTTADVFLATSETAVFPGGTYARTVTVGSLAPGAAVSIPVPIVVPAVDPGAYYVIAQVDAATAVRGSTAMLAGVTAEGAAPTYLRKSLRLRVSQADLAAEALSLSATRVRPGEGLTVSFTVRNAGTVAAGDSDAGVYVAGQPDGGLAQATRLVTQPVGALPVGASVRVMTGLSLPSLPTGTHYIIVAADAVAAIAESNEANNRLAGAVDVLDTADELTVWVADPLTRVQPTDPPGTTRAAAIKAARNEYEAFQLVVQAPSGSGLSNVNVVASDLVGPGRIGQGNIKLYRAQYVTVGTSSPSSPYPPGAYADALIPFTHPETGQALGGRFPAAPFPVSAGRNQPVWVDVYVPSGTPAGTYTGTVTVSASGVGSTTIPVTLTVWNFTLPTASTILSSFGELWDWWKPFGLSPNSPGASDIEWRFSTTALAHRVTVSRPVQTLGWFAADGTALPADTQMRDWLTTRGATTWKIPEFFADPLGADRPKAVRYLRTLYDYLASRGWTERAHIYPARNDEPSGAAAYQAIRDYAAMVHEAHPNLQVLATEHHLTDASQIDSVIDIWVTHFQGFNQSRAQARQAAGKQQWVYQNDAWGGSYMGWMLDYPILNYRVPHWVNWLTRVDGLLYWSMTAWGSISDPWTQTGTYSYGGMVMNGEGSLFYPGNAVGYPGPIASARLKVLRDGMEDYEYLRLLAQVAGTSVADSMARSVATSYSAWNKSAANLQTNREAIAQRIQSGQ